MELTGLSQCTLHSFGIKTKDNGAWSQVSNVAVVTTMCSGNQFPFCDGEGFAGGGGGGEEGAPRDVGTGEARTAAVVGSAENSLLWNAGSSDVRDVMRLAIGSSDPEYGLFLRTTSQRSVGVDHVALGVVDHTPEEVALAGAESVYVGTVGAVSTVSDAAGASLDSSVPYVSRGGDCLYVDLGAGRGRSALIVESKGWSAATTLDSVGIVVERQGQDSSWTTAAIVHPRREFDSFAIPAFGSTRFRLTPLREYAIRVVGKLDVSQVVSPLSLTLASARQTRVGVADGAVRSVDDSRAALAPGDSLAMKFGKTAVPVGKVRDFFVTVKGSHPIGSEESPPAPGTLAKSARAWTFALGPARPNPTTGRVTFSYTLATETEARMRIYDVAGRLLKDLVDGPQAAGPHEVVWDGRTNAGQKAPAGVYFYRIEAGGWHSERKLIVITQ
ncbi:MAG: FlgD immunoglobulin-like domain containing protein [Candidatus Eiseniibacteriota bacterium]